MISQNVKVCTMYRIIILLINLTATWRTVQLPLHACWEWNWHGSVINVYMSFFLKQTRSFLITSSPIFGTAMYNNTNWSVHVFCRPNRMRMVRIVQAKWQSVPKSALASDYNGLSNFDNSAVFNLMLELFWPYNWELILLICLDKSRIAMEQALPFCRISNHFILIGFLALSPILFVGIGSTIAYQCLYGC